MFFLARRHLMARKRQTTLIFLGISLGTMMFTVISGLQLGMREFITERLMNNTSHIKISAKDRLIEQQEISQRFYGDQPVQWLVAPGGKREEAHITYPQGWFNRLREDPAVLGYAPTLAMSVILSHRNSKRPAMLVGIVPSLQRQVMDIEKYITVGKLDDIHGGKVIVGAAMLEEIGAKVGDTIMATVGIEEPRPLKIIGTFSLDVEQLDKTLMYGALKDVQQLNKTPGRINEIAVALVEMDRAQEIADQWKLTSRDKVESWSEANANFLKIFDFQDYTRITVTAAILIVAAFGIYNVLSIMITQKRKEIAILRSIGYPPKMIMELFLIQGIILGITGALIGLSLGHLINLYLATIEIGMGMGGGKTTLMISTSINIYIQGFLLAFISAILASVLPARAASKLTPLDIIRSDV